MQLNHDQLHKLLDLIGESDIQELKLEGDDFRLEVRRNLPGDDNHRDRIHQGVGNARDGIGNTRATGD